MITDIDAVKANGNGRYESCQVHQGERTSNACIKAWFKNDVTPAELLATDAAAKIFAKRRITFQQPEEKGGPCGRSFEDAFMLANATLYPFSGASVEEREAQAWSEAKDVKKSEFALRYALTVQDWNIPRYIRDGLVWLAEEGDVPPLAALSPVVELVA